jgi:hypothetical protein
MSRLFLTSSELGAVSVATGFGVVILAIGALFATRPKLSPNIIAGVLVVFGLGVVAAGVVSAARGERIIEQHEEEHVEDDGGLHPYVPAGTEPATTTTVAEEG